LISYFALLLILVIDGSLCGVDLFTAWEHLIVPPNALAVSEVYDFGLWVESFDGRWAESFVSVLVVADGVPQVGLMNL